MRRFYLPWLCVCVLGSAGLVAAAELQDPAPLLKKLREVGAEGKGNVAAARAWADLTANSGVDQLPTILAAMDGAGPLAINWLRAAVDAIAERQMHEKGKLPLAGLEKFLAEKQHDARARRLAYEWIARADPTAPERLIPTMLDDPSLELRRDAVARVLTRADKALADQKNEPALASYRQALAAARDLDQVKAAAEALKKLNQPVDLAHHFGFVQDWQLIGPFDNRQGKGFDVAYPPEKNVDLAGTYTGLTEKSIGWISHHTDEEYGQVDLNKALDKHMGAVGYAWGAFNADRDQPIELRLGTESANKIWLNGKLLTTNEKYHANGTMDQYVGRGELKRGPNVILLKICQNEQKDSWAQDWKFQLRVCDAAGKAVLATDRGGPRPPQNPTAANTSKEQSSASE